MEDRGGKGVMTPKTSEIILLWILMRWCYRLVNLIRIRIILFFRLIRITWRKLFQISNCQNYFANFAICVNSGLRHAPFDDMVRTIVVSIYHWLPKIRRGRLKCIGECNILDLNGIFLMFFYLIQVHRPLSKIDHGGGDNFDGNTIVMVISNIKYISGFTITL